MQYQAVQLQGLMYAGCKYHKPNAKAVSAEAGEAGLPGVGHPAVCGGQPGLSLC